MGRKAASVRSSSLPRGVSHDPSHRGTKKYKTRVFHLGKEWYIGRFSTVEAAGLAYQQAIACLQDEGSTEADADPAVVKRVQALKTKYSTSLGLFTPKQQRSGSDGQPPPQAGCTPAIPSSQGAAQQQQSGGLSHYSTGSAGAALAAAAEAAAAPTGVSTANMAEMPKHREQQQQQYAMQACNMPRGSQQPTPWQPSGADGADSTMLDSQLGSLISTMLLQEGAAAAAQEQLEQLLQLHVAEQFCATTSASSLAEAQQQLRLGSLNMETLLEQQLELDRLQLACTTKSAPAATAAESTCLAVAAAMTQGNSANTQQSWQQQRLWWQQQQQQAGEGEMDGASELQQLLEQQLRKAVVEVQQQHQQQQRQRPSYESSRGSSVSPGLVSSAMHSSSCCNLAEVGATAAAARAAGAGTDGGSCGGGARPALSAPCGPPICDGRITDISLLMPADAVKQQQQQQQQPATPTFCSVVAAASVPAPTPAPMPAAADAATSMAAGVAGVASFERCSDAAQMVWQFSAALMQLHLDLCCKAEDGDAAGDLMLWMYGFRQQQQQQQQWRASQMQQAVLGSAAAAAAAVAEAGQQEAIQRCAVHLVSRVISSLSSHPSNSSSAAAAAVGGCRRTFVLAVIEKFSAVILQLLDEIRAAAMQQQEGQQQQQQCGLAAQLKQKWMLQLERTAATAEDAMVLKLAALL